MFTQVEVVVLDSFDCTCNKYTIKIMRFNDLPRTDMLAKYVGEICFKTEAQLDDLEITANFQTPQFQSSELTDIDMNDLNQDDRHPPGDSKHNIVLVLEHTAVIQTDCHPPGEKVPNTLSIQFLSSVQTDVIHDDLHPPGKEIQK